MTKHCSGKHALGQLTPHQNNPVLKTQDLHRIEDAIRDTGNISSIIITLIPEEHHDSTVVTHSRRSHIDTLRQSACSPHLNVGLTKDLGLFWDMRRWVLILWILFVRTVESACGMLYPPTTQKLDMTTTAPTWVRAFIKCMALHGLLDEFLTHALLLIAQPLEMETDLTGQKVACFAAPVSLTTWVKKDFYYMVKKSDGIHSSYRWRCVCVCGL